MKKISVVVFLLLLVIAGAFFYSLQQQPKSTQTKEEVIREAKEYRSEEVCASALQPAVHKDTGAEYTFMNGCLPPGWEPKR